MSAPMTVGLKTDLQVERNVTVFYALSQVWFRYETQGCDAIYNKFASILLGSQH